VQRTKRHHAAPNLDVDKIPEGRQQAAIKTTADRADPSGERKTLGRSLLVSFVIGGYEDNEKTARRKWGPSSKKWGAAHREHPLPAEKRWGHRSGFPLDHLKDVGIKYQTRACNRPQYCMLLALS